MNTFLLVIVVVVAIVVVGIGSVFLQVKSMNRERARELQDISVENLEKSVYRYEAKYFRFIGEENEAVREFQELIETRDISNLYKKSANLMRTFASLERKAGHEGRPILKERHKQCLLALELAYPKCHAQHRVHWPLGILSHFRAFFWLRIFPALK
jgi:hypothetical protein